MKEKNKNALRFDTGSINKIMGTIAFICVFIFTTLLTASTKVNNSKYTLWVGVSFAIVAAVIGIVWLVLFLVARKKHVTPNDKAIKQAIKDIEKQKEKEREDAK